MKLEIRCIYCQRFIIEIEFNENSDQDFEVSRVCQQCQKENKLHIEHKTKNPDAC